MYRMKEKDKGVYHNVRCSMSNKQHVEVHKVLSDLNLDIFKSKNQFIIDAIEYYIKALNQEDLTNTAAMEHIRAGQKEGKTDMESMKKEIISEVTLAVQTSVISLLMTEIAKIKAESYRNNQSFEDDEEDDIEPESTVSKTVFSVAKELAEMGV